MQASASNWSFLQSTYANYHLNIVRDIYSWTVAANLSMNLCSAPSRSATKESFYLLRQKLFVNTSDCTFIHIPNISSSKIAICVCLVFQRESLKYGMRGFICGVFIVRTLNNLGFLTRRRHFHWSGTGNQIYLRTGNQAYLEYLAYSFWKFSSCRKLVKLILTACRTLWPILIALANSTCRLNVKH